MLDPCFSEEIFPNIPPEPLLVEGEMAQHMLDPLQVPLASKKPEAHTVPVPAPVLSSHCYLGVVKLHGVICRKGHHEPFLVEIKQGILGVLQEEAVVAEWGHSNGNLGEEVQILQHRALQRRAEVPH